MWQERIAAHLACLTFGLAICGLAACESADNAANGNEPKTGAAAFYDGKRIEWIIPYTPGGGYDEYARVIAPYLEKYTGARVDIYNLPGAGGMRGANELFHSPADGLTIGMINGSGLVTNELAGIAGADYKVSEFVFLGRIVADTRVLAATLDSDYRTFEDMRRAGAELVIGATGLGGSTYVDAVIIKEAFGMKSKIVHGFDSSSVVRQAMLRGSIAATWGSWGSTLDSVDADRHMIVLQSGKVRNPALPDTPTALELVEATPNPARTKAILDSWELLHAVGRPVAVSPGTPPDRVKFLSEALRKALHDPELVAIAERSKRPLDYASGEEVKDMVIAATDMPADIRRLFVAAIKGEL